MTKNRPDDSGRSIQWRMSRLILQMFIPVLAILVFFVLMLVVHNYQYAVVNGNIIDASGFNQNFKDDIDLMMYQYVSGSGDTLPWEEIRTAQRLAERLQARTENADSRKAIANVLRLCDNLETSIRRIEQTQRYDQRMEQLEANVYVITGLIEDHIYTYLYYEAGEMARLQRQLDLRLLLEIAAAVLVLAVIIPLSVHKALRLGRIELALLQAQINPHFLYNTLDAIVWLIETGKNEQAEQMVTSLSAYFRSFLSNGKEIITLAEEELHVRSYLEIQQVRYRDILDYSIDIDPAIRDCRIPKMTLQPLVENAIYHGLKPCRSKGRLEVTGRLSGGVITLRVSDTGAGMQLEALQALRDKIAAEDSTSFGMVAASKRLRLVYGAACSFTVDSRPGCGTTVTICIPEKTEASYETMVV